jgi:hypothetical protein
MLIYLAQSGAEWKLVRSSEWCKRNFEGKRGMVISGIISGALSILSLNVSPTFAGAFAIAGLFGIFTNELTFAFYEGIWNTWQWLRTGVKRVNQFRTERPQVWEDAKLGVKGVGVGIVGLFATLGKIIRFIGFVCTVPSKVNKKVHTVLAR